MKSISSMMGVALLLLAPCAFADLVVVTNPKTPLASLPQSHLTRLFLGQTQVFPDGSAAVPLDVSGEGSHNAFNSEVLKKTPAQLEKYWARMIFTGRGQQPKEIAASVIKRKVAETPGAISYMDRSQVDDSVKIINIVSDR